MRVYSPYESGRDKGPVNIGNPEEFTILELAKKVINMTGSSSKIMKPIPTDPRQRQPDITQAMEILGWEPKVPLDQGLKPTVVF